MKNSVFSKVRLLAGAVLVASLLMLVGCKPVVSGDLVGTWESSYGETFKITEKNFTNLYNNDVSYAGDILEVEEDTSTSGRIFIKYTSNAFYGDDVIGKCYAVYYEDLTDNSIKLSGAYKAEGKTSTDTLKEAKKEFTVENGYFGSGSECVRTK